MRQAKHGKSLATARKERYKTRRDRLHPKRRITDVANSGLQHYLDCCFCGAPFLFSSRDHPVGEFLEGPSNPIRRRNFAEALQQSAGTPGPVARVIHCSIIPPDGAWGGFSDIVEGSAQPGG